jgi:4-amino-4-deoxy-L-arabinose transferase-like glycosyltransferase
MTRDPDARHQTRAWMLLLAVCSIAWFAVLGLRPLFNPDEGRYAEIPAGMLASGDYLVPHLNGLVYLEKPPLQYWLTALAMQVFGHNEWAARVVTASSAAVAVCFVYLLGRRLWSPLRGLTAAAMTASMLLYVLMGQLITLDMTLACFLTISTVSFCLGQLERERDPTTSRRWMLACWAAMAAATLTKGLIGAVLPGAVLVLYTLLQRDWAVWRHLQWLRGLTLYSVLTLPWFVLVERAHPGALDFLIVREHFQRYLTKVHDRYHPWWYFLMILAAGSLPWLPQITRALLTGWRRTAPFGRFDADRVLWVSAAFTLLFFSLSDSKLAPYIVPILPPLALLGSGRGRSAAIDLTRAAALQVIFGAALVIALVVYGQRPLVGDPAWTFKTLTPWITAVATALVIGGAGALWLRRRSPDAALRAVAATGFAVTLALITGGATAIAGRYSVKPLLAATAPLADGAPIYTVDTFDWTLPFYVRRPVIPVLYRGELDYGLTAAPERGLPTLEAFAARWARDDVAYALIPIATAAKLTHDGIAMRELTRDFDNVLVSRR